MTNTPLTVVKDLEDADQRKLTFITKLCGGGSCPTVYRTDRDTYVVQGYTVPAETVGLDLPVGEQLVEVPVQLLAEIVKAGAYEEH